MYFNGENDRYELLGEEPMVESVDLLCVVTDNKGRHCHEKPKYFFDIDDEVIGFCESCYRSYKQGAFDNIDKSNGDQKSMPIISE